MSLLLVRTDAGAELGMGHAMRCLALAQAWRGRGGEVRFRMADPPKSLEARLPAEGMALEQASAAPGSREDAAATAERARGLGAEAVVLDGYQFGADYRGALRRQCEAPVLVIDDLGGEGPWEADVLLNQNLHAQEAMYPGYTPGAELLLGPRFALLRAEIRAVGARPPRTGEVRTILVTFGGADPVDATSRFLPALASLSRSRKVGVLVGPANARRERLRAAASEVSSGIEVLTAGSDYPRLLAEADLVVTAAGSTCWELCFLGVPFVTVVLAENQTAIAASLDAAGAAVDLGWHGSLAVARLAATLAELAADAPRRRAMGEAGQRLVDGLGAERVADTVAARKAA
jgi:UDP-2,4-diacetamido-2,4,6-trideoxy-beta-L-altropyranose hydrolase